jgi:hypothetical protein
MTMPDGWIRVSRPRPCPVCERSDWCLIKIDGSEACCKRVISDRQMGEAGSIHRLEDCQAIPDHVIRKMVERRPEPDVPMWKLAKMYHEEIISREMIKPMSSLLGVSEGSLISLRVGWSKTHDAFSFPMRDAKKRICGIRLRRPNGRKYSVIDSRSGLFIGMDGKEDPEMLCICEGPTDTAAMIDLGFDVIGRPDCGSGTEMLVNYVKCNRRDVVIVHDRDEPNSAAEANVMRGVSVLTDRLLGIAKSVRVIAPPSSKDIREWVGEGATRDTVRAVIDQIPFKQTAKAEAIY